MIPGIKTVLVASISPRSVRSYEVLAYFSYFTIDHQHIILFFDALCDC